MTALKATKKFAKEQIVDRVNPKTTGSKWKKIRNWCGIGSSVLLLLVSPICPIALPAGVAGWVTFGGTVLGIVAGRAHMDKSNR